MKRRRIRNSFIANPSSVDDNIIFNSEDPNLYECSICYNPGVLINPCECKECRYHQKCLLKHIRTIIIRRVRQGQQVDMTDIKCLQCHAKYHLVFQYKSFYDCSKCKGLGSIICTRLACLLLTILLLIIATSIIFIYLGLDGKSKSLFYGLLSGLVIEFLIFLAILMNCVHSCMLRKQFILRSVSDIIDLRSYESSSDENKADEDAQILIREQQI